MKLRTKIQLFSSLFILILVLLVNTSIYFLFHKVAADRELEELIGETNTIVEAISSNRDSVTSELLQAYLPSDGMIRVIKEDGTLQLPLLKKPNISESLPSEFTNSETQTTLSQDQGPEVAMVAKPIVWQNGEIVTLQVSNQLVALNENMATLFFVLVVASIIMLVPTIVAGSMLSKVLVRPIQALTQTMKGNMEHGNWQKIEVDTRSKDELYEMEETFNHMIDSLKENFEKQEVFVSDASHELKTPISIIKSYAQLLRRRGQEDPNVINESIEAIETETNRMQQLVEQMLMLAKQKEVGQFEDVDFVKLIEDTIYTFEGAYTRDIQFDQDIHSLIVHGNKSQIQQLLYILMHNAMKYSDDDIIVRLEHQHNTVTVRITDYGVGIPESEQDKIFDRFYRVDKARSRETGGTGLGLAIAKTIAVAHKGDLKVNSKLGKGSTFSIVLPIVKRN
ncbi:sensor histidine kinase [Oceanobacillus halotolerans]|uniref:sensor histidine kinase n=1 Tax=Oceanobacillus halotolerans TaxID=2663380 RepID=UPI0013DBD6AB|nr:ATP-binding protein [Oceanobacillus halotolerans]